MLHAPHSRRRRPAPSGAPTREIDPLATLQRSLGNRAMGKLLQRDPKDKDDLVAHVEGFAAALAGTPAPSAAVVLKDPLPKAVDELQAAAKAKGDKSKAEKRLKDLYGSLKADQQLLLRDWLSYLYERASVEWPKRATDDEAKAAAKVYKAFHPRLEFLKWASKVVGGADFAAVALAAPSDVHRVAVDDKQRPTPKTVDVGEGKVKVYIDYGYRLADGPRSHGISLAYEGKDAQEMRWLQFIWREVVPAKGSPVTGTLHHQKSQYDMTTQAGEPSQIHYNTDTASYGNGEPEKGFYELENSVNRTSNRIEIFDEPSSPYSDFIKAGFASSPGGVTGRAHLIDYLIKGNQVLFKSEIDFEYLYKSAADDPPAKPKLKSAGKASALDPLQRARLRQQFGKLDYLP